MMVAGWASRVNDSKPSGLAGSFTLGVILSAAVFQAERRISRSTELMRKSNAHACQIGSS